MKVYLAARFSRQDELRGHAAELFDAGVRVTSRWLTGAHEWTGTPDEDIELTVQRRFAAEDLEDIEAADVVVCFTEPSRSGPARGGRHFEAGYAYARRIPVWVVGPVENVFYALGDVRRFATWADAFDELAIRAAIEGLGGGNGG